MELKNRTILITGGTSGFGLEFATRFLKLGNTVIVTGRNQTKLDQVKAQLPGVHTIRSDVSDPQAIAELFVQVTRRFPDLDVLINNAGEMRRLDLLDETVDQDDVNREIAIDLSGPIWMIQKFLPLLRSKKKAAIINVTSGLAFVPFPLSPVYSAAKAGLRAYTRSLRVQLKRTKIQVFELAAPGAKTPLNDQFAGDQDDRILMDPRRLIDEAMKGLASDRLEILPGASKLLKSLIRIAPGLPFRLMSTMAEKAFAKKRTNS